MHRSGTSVLTGVLGSMGLALPHPDDQWDPEPSNPEHFESIVLGRFNDRLLEFLGGSWDAPPRFPPGWEQQPGVRAFDADARRAARLAFPGDGAVVWKDPRACLVLPYWRRLLPGSFAAVLMWREPGEVARSLRDRDGLSLPLGAALWEEYNRAALRYLEGSPVYVTSYDELLGDPAGLCRALGGWLDSVELLASRRGTWDLEGWAGLVTGTLRHQSTVGEEPLLASQEEVVRRLRELGGAHEALPASGLGPASPWATAVLDEHRSGIALGRRAESSEEALRAAEETNQRLQLQLREAARLTDETRRTVRALRASTSWRVTRPLRALSARRSRNRAIH